MVLPAIYFRTTSLGDLGENSIKGNLRTFTAISLPALPRASVKTRFKLSQLVAAD
jgi:hypothetical protein